MSLRISMTTRALLAVGLVALGCTGCGGSAAAEHNGVEPLPSLAVFATPPDETDLLPPTVSAVLLRSATPEFTNADLRQARRVLADKPGWLVPASNGEICLVDLVYPTVSKPDGNALPPSPVESCAPEGEAQAGRLVETQSLTASVYARLARVIGVAANGTSTVSVLFRNRRPLVINVLRNAYEVVAREPIGIRFTERVGHRTDTHTVSLSLIQAKNKLPPSSRGNPRGH